MNWWLPHKFEEKRPYLEARARVIKAIRQYFDDQDFLEVETPVLQTCPTVDTHIHGFATDLKGVDGDFERTLYLQTSPEFAMKKLLVAGLPKIYQICHVFRNAENTARHSPEFTMIEWYRSGANYTDIMADCERLVQTSSDTLSIKEYCFKSNKCNPYLKWKKLSVCEAFEEYAQLDLTAYLPPLIPPASGGEAAQAAGGEHVIRFREAISAKGIRTSEGDQWDDLFFRVMDAKIEPHLGMGVPTILYDYPVCMASLARKKPDDPRFAERFELYICGIELANAFSELTDADEQRTRFKEEMDAKERLYGERYPVDEDFIKALEHGMPEAGGIALGIDRLVMLATGAEDIDQVLWAGKP